MTGSFQISLMGFLPSSHSTIVTTVVLEQMTHFVLFWSEACVHSDWVKKELSAATAKLIGNQLPIFVVRLDNAPVPAILSDRYSIEGSSMSSSEIGNAIVDAVEGLVKRNGA